MVVADVDIAALLGVYAGAPSIHTVRPVPSSAKYPLVIIGPELGRGGSEDGINDHRPLLVLDVITYGQNPSDYLAVEEIAERLFTLFHRSQLLIIPNYSTTSVTAFGPAPASTDDEKEIARRVTLSIELRAKEL